MVKIKSKKQMNLPQLIEWVIENKKFGCTYISDNFNKVYVTDDGIIEFNGSFYRDIFTIITFEEITEDTVFKELICLDVDDKYNSYDNVCVLDFDDDRVRVIYIPNSDLTMTLIWRDGKLVE